MLPEFPADIVFVIFLKVLQVISLNATFNSVGQAIHKQVKLFKIKTIQTVNDS